MASFLSRVLSTAASRASSPGGRRIMLGTGAAAISFGASYYFSPPTIAQLDWRSKESDGKVALPAHKWLEVKLQETSKISHNSVLLRFTFDPAARLGLDAASCIFARARLVGGFMGRKRYIIRPYTPISDVDSKGYFDLLVKVYPDGKMSQHFASLKPGDVVEVKGPLPKLRYSPNMKKKIGMIAGGTGITPMLQVINAVLKNPEDNTQVSLIFANTTEDDILLKEELNRLSDSHQNFKVLYTVSKPPEKWSGDVGHVSKDMILKNLPGPEEDALILVCGPPGMMKHISGESKRRSQGEFEGLLKDLGYKQEMVYKF